MPGSVQSSPLFPSEDDFPLSDLAYNDYTGMTSSSVYLSPSRTNSSSISPLSGLDSRLLGNYEVQEKARKADAWFDELSDSIRLVSGYTNFNYRHLKQGLGPYPPVKIAVIDTGLAEAPTCRPPPDVQRFRRQIRGFKSFLDDPQDLLPNDLDGHGTHCAMLALRVCPNAHLYVARVVEKSGDNLCPERVAKAIRHAANPIGGGGGGGGWGVDIISLSMGWDEDHDAVTDALKLAQDHRVLVFAATANDGLRGRSGVMFPARRFNVVSADAADGDGDPSAGNPPPDPTVGLRFAAPGDSVRSAWPRGPAAPAGERRMSGASVATPVVAGAVGLILEFARQPPLGYQPHIAHMLKDMDHMKDLLRERFSEPCGHHPYYFLKPWKSFFCRNSQFGGDAHDTSSARYRAAVKIIHFFENKRQDVRSLTVTELTEFQRYQGQFPSSNG